MPTLTPEALRKGEPISSRTEASLLLSCVHWTRYTVQAPCPAARLSEGEPAKSRDRDASGRVWDRSPLPGRAAPRRDQLTKIPFPEPPLTGDGADTPSSRRFSTDESVPCATVASGSHGLSSMGLVPLQGLRKGRCAPSPNRSSTRRPRLSSVACSKHLSANCDTIPPAVAVHAAEAACPSRRSLSGLWSASPASSLPEPEGSDWRGGCGPQPSWGF
jgi:hypothetical protein